MSSQDSLPRRVARTSSAGREWLTRAYRRSGRERDLALLIFKSTLAATLAWIVARHWLHAQAPAFAPFSAVLLVHVTVYQSIVQSLRYVAAVLGGILLQAALGFAIGPNPVAFAVMALLALIVARWGPLGSQGTQVATAAFFAFSLFSFATTNPARLAELGQVMLIVVIGAGTGVLINIMVFPPLRYRGAEDGLQTLSRSIANTVSDVAAVLRQDSVADWPVARWRQRAAGLRSVVEQTRNSVAFARETVYYNPRLWWMSSRRNTFPSYDEIVESLDRVVEQVVSITRTLEYGHESEHETAGRDFSAQYGRFLDSVNACATELSEFDVDRIAQQSAALADRVDAAERQYRQLCEATDSGPPNLVADSRHRGVLLIEAQRLTEELRHNADTLHEASREQPGESR